MSWHATKKRRCDGNEDVAKAPQAAPQGKEQIVAILDAGAQYGKVIDRRVRELKVKTDILPLSTPVAKLREYNAIIISGGPQSVYAPNAPKCDPKLFELGIPVFGICYGFQLINFHHEGTVGAKAIREDGQFSININSKESMIFAGLGDKVNVLLTHGDSVDKVAKGFTVTGKSNDIVAAIENRERNIYGVQFHPEVDLTERGMDMFRNFLFNVCKLEPSFTMEDRLELAKREIREHVGDSTVLVLVSGGVDSSVCAALLHEALKPEQIFCLHVNNGFMRYKESERVADALKTIGLDVKVVDAREEFFNARTTIDGVKTKALKETVDPQAKRKIIGDMFMTVSNEHVKNLKLDLSNTYLCQGTLRPDLIESASSVVSSHADVIKTHHNDTEMVRALRDAGRIVEPLKDYHKDEVRALGTRLGLPEYLVWRQPFPGPGLAIRILCSEEPFTTPLDNQIIKQLAAYDRNNIRATLVPCRTVGVQGDQRTYSSLVALSCSTNKPDWQILKNMAKDIPRTIHGINRVVFAFGKQVNEDRLERVTQTHLTPDVILQLQKADDVVNQILLKYELTKILSQVPVVLFPADFGVEGARSICIRTFITNDFMTGVPAIPGEHIKESILLEMVEGILKVEGIARVCYDLTPKPPATTEWE